MTSCNKDTQHNRRTINHREIKKRIDRTIYQKFEIQNGSRTIFINNFERLMMTSVGRNNECDVKELLNMS
jgi:hypothetical protein